jgi:hypothetical protein
MRQDGLIKYPINREKTNVPIFFCEFGSFSRSHWVRTRKFRLCNWSDYSFDSLTGCCLSWKRLKLKRIFDVMRREAEHIII